MNGINHFLAHLVRNLLSATCLVLFSCQLHAQLSTYTFSAHGSTFVEISLAGGAVQPWISGGGPGDYYYNNIPIGFNFYFDGNFYSTLAATTNGYAVLGASLTWAPSYNDLTNFTPRPILAPLWDNLNSSSVNGSLIYQVVGQAPERVFILQWLNMKWTYLNILPVISFQVRLHETSNTVEFIYRQETNLPSSDAGASIGIAGTGTGAGNFISLENTSASPTISLITETTTINTRPATGQAYYFSPPSPTQPPNCAIPTAPANGSLNQPIYPSLNWSSGGGNTSGYLLFFGSDGGGVIPPGNLVNGDTVTPPYSLQVPLNYGTTYYWQVVPYNANGPASGCPIESFTVMADPTVAAFPFLESFEASVPPLHWVETVVNPGSGPMPDWSMETQGSDPSCMPHGGLAMAMFNSYSCYSGSQARLVTPPLSLGSLAAPSLSFWMYHDHGFSSAANEGIQVQVSANSLTWTNIGSLISRYDPTDHWQQHVLDLSAFAGQTVYLGFLGVGHYGNNIFMDEVYISDASGLPPCANLGYPADGDTAVPAAPSFIFSQGGIPQASGFRLYLGTDGGGVSLPTNVINGTVVTSPFLPTVPLSYSVTYYWTAIPFNNSGSAAGCPIHHFKVEADLTLPIPYFENFDASTSLPPHWASDFTVDSLAGTNGTNGLTREIWSFDPTGYFVSPPIGPLTQNTVVQFDYNILEVYSYPPSGTVLDSTDKIVLMASNNSGISYDTIYTIDQSNHVPSTVFARLSAALANYAGMAVMLRLEIQSGNSQWSFNVDNFAVFDTTTAPPCTTPLSPVSGSNGIALNASLSWQDVAGVTGYILNFGSDGGGLTTPTNIVSGVVTSSPYLQSSPLAYSTTYFWQIIPFNSNGSPANCPIWSFTTGPEPGNHLPWSEYFDNSYNLPAGWTANMYVQNNHGVNNSNALSRELANWCPMGLAITPIVGPVSANSVLEFRYRIVNYVGYPNSPTNLFGGDKVYIMVSADNGMTYDTLSTIDSSNHVPSTQFALYSHSLAPYNGLSVSAKVVEVREYGDYYIDLDEFMIYDHYLPPPCATPVRPLPGDTGVEITDSLVWQYASGASAYRLYFGTDGGGLVPPTNIENGIVLNPPYLLNLPLAYATTYYWQVVPFNDQGSPSNCPIWSFTTRTDPTRPLPWTEDFDSSYNLPADWLSDMMILGNHGTSGSQGLATSLANLYPDCYAVTPPVGPVTSSTFVEFRYRLVNVSGYPNNPAFPGSTDKIYLMITTDNGLSYDTIYTINSTNHTPSTQFALLSLNLGSYDGNTVRFRIRAVRYTGSYYLDLDDFAIFDNSLPPACSGLSSPTNGSINVSASTQLVWTATSGAAGFHLFFGTDGGGVVPPTNIANGISAVSPYQPAPPLNFSTTYYWQVVPYNAAGFPTDCPVYAFTTMANPAISVFPYSEGFESTVPPLGWSEEVVVPGSYSAPSWLKVSVSVHPAGVPPHEGNYMARFNSYNCGSGATDRLRTPPVNFTNCNAPLISFWMFHDNGYSSNAMEGVHIEVSTDGAVWSDAGLNFPRYSSVIHWEEHSVDLSAWGGQTVYIGIVGYSQFGNDCYIDGLKIINQVFTANAGPDTAVCAGGSVQLHASAVAGVPPYSYSWTPPTGLNNPNTPDPIAIPAVTTTYVVHVMDSTGQVVTDEVVVTVNPLPVVAMVPFNPACVNWPPITLYGGWPAGGTYSGPGVNGGYFYPGTAGTGTHTITYTYTDPNGCTNHASEPWEVSPCTGTEEYSKTPEILVVPNPSPGVFDLVVSGFEGHAVLRVLSLQGKSVLENRTECLQSGGSTVHLDLRNLPRGIYYLKVEGEKEVRTGKLILQ